MSIVLKLVYGRQVWKGGSLTGSYFFVCELQGQQCPWWCFVALVINDRCIQHTCVPTTYPKHSTRIVATGR